MTGRRTPRREVRSRPGERREDPPAAPRAEVDGVRLLHELQVHQVELEQQNEELRQTRGQLETALERQIELFDFAPIGYVSLDERSIVRDVNFAGARLLGAPRRELVGHPFSRFVQERDLPSLELLLRDALTGAAVDEPAARALDVELTTPEATLRVHVTVGAGHGNPRTALLAIEDVTARRVAEDALHEELRRRDDFLGTLSHELRNPLAPIRNGLYLLRHVEPGSEGARRALAIIERQAAHLTRLVDDLLDVTRIARGKLRLQRRVEDVADLLQRALDDHASAFEAAGVRLASWLDPEPCWADVDATRLAQVIGNLLANALKFTAPGGRVDVALRAEGNILTLSVRDDGAGIAPEVMERLFVPFSQGPQGLARSAGGLGLGLATVRGLVELHGGTVGIASAGVGQGTEVRVRLPRARAPAGRGPDGPAPGAPAHRVLVIDDNVDAADTLKDILEAAGHLVRAAHDGPSGLEAARAFQPDVVLCDIGLPGPDGFEVARALRADPDLCAAYLVALSGYARPEDVQRSTEAGFDQHVAKPASLERLEAVLAAAPCAPRPPAQPSRD